MMSAIYKHYKGSELEVLVTGGVIADGSLEHVLKGKQYKRGLCCLRLMIRHSSVLCLTWLMRESRTPKF